jgi:hypothetical protein
MSTVPAGDPSQHRQHADRDHARDAGGQYLEGPQVVRGRIAGPSATMRSTTNAINIAGAAAATRHRPRQRSRPHTGERKPSTMERAAFIALLQDGREARAAGQAASRR